jgi:hypothetical protein
MNSNEPDDILFRKNRSNEKEAMNHRLSYISLILPMKDSGNSNNRTITIKPVCNSTFIVLYNM